jgi:diaminopimelate epimerase
MALRFGKYEGIGNDFLVVDAETRTRSARAARSLCDRHYGVGGDGVLLSAPPVTPGAHGRMVVLNSRRLAARGLRQRSALRGAGVARKLGQTRAELVIDTDAGRARRWSKRAATSADVTVSMGKATREGEVRAQHRGEELTFQRISMGNPHAIVFDVGCTEQSWTSWGRAFRSRCRRQQRRVVRATGRPRSTCWLWERGVGYAGCGTGAARWRRWPPHGRAPLRRADPLRLPGAPLECTVREDLADAARPGATCSPARFPNRDFQRSALELNVVAIVPMRNDDRADERDAKGSGDG